MGMRGSWVWNKWGARGFHVCGVGILSGVRVKAVCAFQTTDAASRERVRWGPRNTAYLRVALREAVGVPDVLKALECQGGTHLATT